MQDESKRFSGFYDALRAWPDLNARVGGGDPEEVGRLSLATLTQCGLPLDRPVVVCDYGCGVGRVTAAVAGAIWKGSRLVGVDIVPEFVDFCARHLHDKDVGLQFMLLDAQNEHYPTATKSSAEGLPRHTLQAVAEALQNSVDFLFSVSVFTHLTPAMADDTFKCISAALKRGGTAAISCFLYDTEVEKCRHAGRIYSAFCLDGGYWAGPAFFGSRDDPLAFVAYRPEGLLGLAVSHGLSLRQYVAGGWRGTGITTCSLQDYLVFEKTH